MKKRFKVLSLLLIIFGLYYSSAKAKNVQITGKVFDFVSSEELPDVKIYIKNVESGSVDSTTTNSIGYWEHDFSQTSVNETEGLPVKFSVSQNYPNPFNPSTRIHFFIPEADVVKITIYNTLGAIVDSRKEFLPLGNHSIMWNSKGSAGVYFFNVKSKKGSVTKKMTLLDGGNGSGLSPFQSVSKPELSKTGTNIPIQISTEKFGYLSHTLESQVQGGEYFEFSIETIHSASLLADLHNDILEKMIDQTHYHLADLHSYNHTDIPRLLLGGVDLQIFVVWVNPSTHLQNSYDYAMEMVNIFNTEMSLSPQYIEQARSETEALSIINQDKIAAVIGVEGAHAIENDLEKLISLYNAGMRYLTITWNNSLDWAVSAKDSRSGTVGLSEFGKQVIRTLDSLGVMIDVSHVGIKTIEDILETTTNPIIASHSGVRSLRNHYRNLYDEQIVAIANTGGVIGVVFYPPFLTYTGVADIPRVANHIDYIVNLVGIDYVAIGSDFDGIGNNTVNGLENVTKFPDLTLELLRRGYSREEIDKINGGNFMRVFETVCGE
jgi:membrane dipeptidase